MNRCRIVETLGEMGFRKPIKFHSVYTANSRVYNLKKECKHTTLIWWFKWLHNNTKLIYIPLSFSQQSAIIDSIYQATCFFFSNYLSVFWFLNYDNLMTLKTALFGIKMIDMEDKYNRFDNPEIWWQMKFEFPFLHVFIIELHMLSYLRNLQ